MARLPGIQYGASVPSLGREDPRGPMRLASAEAKALQQVGVGVAEVGNVILNLRVDEGRLAAADASSVFTQAEAEAAINPDLDERQAQLETSRKSIAAEYGGTLKSVEARKAFDDAFNKWSQDGVDRLVARTVVEKHQAIVSSTIESSLRMARDEPQLFDEESGWDVFPTDAIGLISGNNSFSDENKEGFIRDTVLEFEVGRVERIAASGNPERIQSLLDYIDSESYPGLLQDNARRTATAQLRSAYKRSTKEMDVAIAREDELFASKLEIEVFEGSSGETEVVAAFDNGRITGAKRTQLIKMAREVSKEFEFTLDAVVFVQEALANGDSLDRKDTSSTGDVAKVDAFYDYLIELDWPQVALDQVGINLAVRTNIMPEKFESDLRKVAFSGAADSVERAANIMETLQRQAPQTLNDFGTQEKAVYATVSQMTRLGTPLSDAVEKARELATADPARTSIRREIFQQKVGSGDEAYSGHLKARLRADNERFDKSWVPLRLGYRVSPMQREAYRQLMGVYYEYTGDLELAAEQAWQDWRGIMSVSGINGEPRLMAYGPESEYGYNPSGDSDIMKAVKPYRADFERFLKDKGLPVEGAEVVQDGMTARGKLGDRSYAVYTVDPKTKMFKLSMERWRPDITSMKKRRAGAAEAERLRRIERQEAFEERQRTEPMERFQ